MAAERQRGRLWRWLQGRRTGTPTLRARLRRRLLIFLLPITALSMLGAYFAALHFADAAFDHALARRAYALADLVRVIDGKVGVNLPQEARDILEFDPADVLYYRMIGPHGETLAGNAQLDFKPDLGRRQEHHSTLRLVWAQHDGEPVRAAIHRLSLAGTSAQGYVTILAAETLDKRTRLADQVLTILILPMLALALLTLYAVDAGVRLSLRPVELLRQAIGRRQAHDLTPIAVQDVAAEIRPLLDEMNRLLADVARLHALNQTFLADAAHQMRTPLAAQQAQLQLLRDELGIQGCLLDPVLDNLQRQTRLVAQLLALSRAENQAHVAPCENVDLVALAKNIAESWVVRFLRAGIELGFEADAPVRVRANAFALEEALGNLFDNVLQHGVQANTVTVQVHTCSGGGELTVADDGVGTPAAEWPGLTARFVRGAHAHGPGSGLGLAIVEEIVRTYGGHMQLGSGLAGRGFAVTMIFPSLP